MITRDNYEAFISEPALTKDEWRRIFSLQRQCQTDEALTLSILAATKAEREAYDKAHQLNTSDWSDIVACADANRKLRRAQIKAIEGLPAGAREEDNE